MGDSIEAIKTRDEQDYPKRVQYTARLERLVSDRHNLLAEIDRLKAELAACQAGEDSY